MLISLMLYFFDVFGDNKLEVANNTVEISAGGKKICIYKYKEVPFKPYIKEFYTPSGLQILEDAPPDHLHHHGIMFAVSVNGVNFWEEKANSSGMQAHLDFNLINPIDLTGKINYSVFCEELDWNAPDGKVLIKEAREIRCGYWSQKTANVIFWKTNLKNPSNDKVELGGNHYFGLGVRLLTTPIEKVKIITNFEENLENVRGDEYLRTSPWCALTLENEKGSFSVLLVDLKSSVRYPARWFTMRVPFVYVSATRNLWKENLVIPPGGEATFETAIVVWDGLKSEEEMIDAVREIQEMK
ncbi:MAG: PmoA family protein [Candidatus Hydrogenedentes bacterium]|nr:PmoA family protein [Candidatus Hydrogenedentota bacterium]